MSRCCIYCRIGGTANEPNQIAMNSQLEMLRKAAEDLGLTVVAEVTVFESGTDPQRQSIKTLIRDGKHGAYGKSLRRLAWKRADRYRLWVRE